MSNAGTHLRPKAAKGLAWRGGSPSTVEDRKFRWSLGVALLAHALFLFGFYADLYPDKRRRLGDPSGLDGAISIELATDADLHSLAAVADRAGEPAQTPLDPGAEATPLNAPPPSEQSAQLLKAVPPVPSLAPGPKPAIPAEPQKAPAKTNSTPHGQFRPSEAEPPLPHAGEEKKALSAPKAPTPQKDAKSQEQRQPQPKQSPTPKPLLTTKLDLTLPPSAFSRQTFTGTGAGIERPAGITRSGENDDFARGVVRALQRTMPQLKDTLGQVTVRITLDSNGNLASTEVVRKSNIAGLDQSVVFATKQSSFPIPPKNHVPADLVFLVTYVYR